MGGGLMQITSYGTQDLTLTGNPEITFFNIIYRRYTNFSPQYIHDQILDDQNINDQIVNDEKRIALIEEVIYSSIIHRNTDCAICITDYDTDSKVYVTECNHVYHYDCFTQFIQNNNFSNRCNCPLCRTFPTNWWGILAIQINIKVEIINHI